MDDTVALDTVSGLQGPALRGVSGPMAVTPDGRTVYVAGRDAVIPIDTATNTAGRVISLPAGDYGQIAISPDGTTVLVARAMSNSVIPISTATDVAGAPIAVDHPTAVAVAPDGRTAYVISAGRTITPIDLPAGTPRAPFAIGQQGESVAITPDGTLLLVGESDTTPFAPAHGAVQVVNLRTGEVEPPVPLDGPALKGLAIVPDGRTAYVSVLVDDGGVRVDLRSGEVVPFDIPSRTLGPPLGVPLSSGGAAGALAVSGDGRSLVGVVPCNDPHCVTGFAFALDLSVPMSVLREFGLPELNQGTHGANPDTIALVPSPSAGFLAAAGPTGALSRFDASASANAGGTVSGYAWDFGDGTPTQTSTGPTASHAYALPGSYTVTLTTTNQGGCAAALVYTGQSASCTGSSTATAKRTVTVTSPIATVRTGAVGARTASRATLHGTVASTGGSVRWRFEYGATASYGRTTPARWLSPAQGPVAVRSALKRLSPNASYHYRLIAETTVGAAPPTFGHGLDATFRTAVNGKLRLLAAALRATHDAVLLPLRCLSSAPCRGRVSLRVRTRAAHRFLITPCGHGAVHLAARRGGSVRVALPGACGALLRRGARHGLRVMVRGTFTSGQRKLAVTTRLTDGAGLR